MQDEDEKAENDRALDEFLDAMGLDTKPLSPEHALMLKLTGGSGYKEIHMYRYWVRHELFYYYHFTDLGYELHKPSYNKELAKMEKIKADKYDWIKVRTKYYLQMKYLPWLINDLSTIGNVDSDRMTQMMMEHEDIAQVIEMKKEDLPKN